jgi:hypothetical protein
MSERQSDKITKTASRMFEIEQEIKGHFKPQEQISREERQAQIKKFESLHLQTTRYIETLESVYKKKLESPRTNSTKQNYAHQKQHLEDIENKLKELRG